MRTSWGDVIAFQDDDDGSRLLIRLPEKVGEILKRRKIQTVEVSYDDGRSISPVQRRKIYATLRDISEHTGYDPESAKQILKTEHILRTGEKAFSLSDCSMTTAREFINTLMDYALREGIILTDTGLQRTDDIDTYLIQCIRYRRCCICGRGAEIHHVDAIGMGHDRRQVDDSEKEIMALCREHHTISHAMGQERFARMYAVYGIRKGRVEDDGRSNGYAQDSNPGISNFGVDG